MTIYLLSLHKDVLKIISDELEKLEHKCVIFSNESVLFNTFNKKNIAPDLLAIDYTMWNHDIFPILTYLKEQNFFQPFLYYNDPCPVLPDRCEHWCIQLRTLINMFPMKTLEEEYAFIDNYRPVFKQIQNIVESKALSPYIPLMQAEKPLPEGLPLVNTYKFLQSGILRRESIYDFAKKVSLPKNLLFLLSMFSENINVPLSKKQIINYYVDNGKKLKEESITVLISNLKKYIEKDALCKYTIAKKGESYIFNILD